MMGNSSPTLPAFQSLIVFLAAAVITAADGWAGEADVVPLLWERFASSAPPSDDLQLAARPLLNAARYNLEWAPSGAEKVEQGWREFEKMICTTSSAQPARRRLHWRSS